MYRYKSNTRLASRETVTQEVTGLMGMVAGWTDSAKQSLNSAEAMLAEIEHSLGTEGLQGLQTEAQEHIEEMANANAAVTELDRKIRITYNRWNKPV